MAIAVIEDRRPRLFEDAMLARGLVVLSIAASMVYVPHVEMIVSAGARLKLWMVMMAILWAVRVEAGAFSGGVAELVALVGSSVSILLLPFPFFAWYNTDVANGEALMLLLVVGVGIYFEKRLLVVLVVAVLWVVLVESGPVSMHGTTLIIVALGAVVALGRNR
jgi:hypothetical protein